MMTKICVISFMLMSLIACSHNASADEGGQEEEKQEIVVALSEYLHDPDTKKKILIIEPGTLLKVIKIKERTDYDYEIYTVQTLSGIVGEISSEYVKKYEFYEKFVTSSINDHYNKVEEGGIVGTRQSTLIFNDRDIGAVAFLKRESYRGLRGPVFNKEYGKYPSYFVRITNEYGYKNKYRILVPSIIYSLTEGMGVKNKFQEFDISKDELNTNFNLVQPNNQEFDFLKWVEGKIKDNQWGCPGRSSMTQTTTVNLTNKNKIGLGWDFFNFFRADTEVTNKNTTTKTYTLSKSDNEFSHKISWWRLINDKDDSHLEIILEKIIGCDKSKATNWHYCVTFKENYGMDEIIINRALWGDSNVGHGFKKADKKPFKLNHIDDYHKLIDIFKRSYSVHINGKDLSSAVWDFVISKTIDIE